MKYLDERLTFVEYAYHPLVRGFLGWARGQVVECVEGSGREWGGLVGELELLLSGEYHGENPVDEILPEGLEPNGGFYPVRLIDHVVIESDRRMSLMMDREEVEGWEDRLVWTVGYLDEVLEAQERVLAKMEAYKADPPEPDYRIISGPESGTLYGSLHTFRRFCYPEIDYEMSDFEVEMVKEYARVMPPFEDFSENPTSFLGVFRWLLLQAQEAARTNDERWEGVFREFANLECGVYEDRSPELIIASSDPTSFDFEQLRYFYVHALLDIEENVHMVNSPGSWGGLSPTLSSYLDVDISSRPAIAAWYLEADLKYLEALAERTPQLVA